VRDVYALYRPTPAPARRALGKGARDAGHIYYKYEGVSPAGSHKPNTAIPQAYYNKVAGTKAARDRNRRRAVGSSLPCVQRVRLECNIYMVKGELSSRSRIASCSWRPTARTVHASPSTETDFGRKVLAADPTRTGSLDGDQRSDRGHGETSRHETRSAAC